MDLSFNESIEEEMLRSADKVIKETLVQNITNEYEYDNITDNYDKELEKAIFLSMQENIQQQRQNQEYEDKVVNDYNKEIFERREKFKDLLFDLHKISKFDKNIKEIYEIIEPIIEAYCNQFIEYYVVDEAMYTSIFNILSTIRTNKKNIENIKAIILLN
jgi:DNA repair exonuclease SbcCD ATPase subunit